MSPNTATNAPVIMTAATSVGGVFTLVSKYSTEITVIAVVLSAVASIVYGFWNSRIQSRRNEINEAIITSKIIRKIEKSGVIDGDKIDLIKNELDID